LNAGEDAAVRTAALVAQDLAGEDLGIRRHPVARQALRRRGPAGGSDAVRAVAMAVLHRLAGDEALRLDRPGGEIGVLEVHAGVEDREPDALPGLARARDPRALQAPGELDLAERRGRPGEQLGHGPRRLAEQPADQLVDRLAIAAQVVDRPGGRGAAGRRRGAGRRHRRGLVLRLHRRAPAPAGGVPLRRPPPPDLAIVVSCR
jgi:hypothetical protein